MNNQNNPTSTAADVELDRYIHEYLYVMSTSDLKIVKAQFSIGLKQRIDDVIAARDKQLIKQMEGLKQSGLEDVPPDESVDELVERNWRRGRVTGNNEAINAAIALIKQEKTDG